MKKILSVLVVIVSMNAMSDCMPAKASSKTLYPVSKEALEVAQETGLKTCNRSIRFAQTFKAKFKKDYKIETFDESKIK